MPFEPLKTDEPNTVRGKSGKTDFERQLMGGCGTIVAASFIVYFLVIWPWFIYPTHTVSGLAKTAIYGMGTAMIFGGIVTRKFASAGGAGFLGGVMASVVFIYLRLQQIMLAQGQPDLPQPEYPNRWVSLVPIAWLLCGIAFAIVLWPKEAEEHPAAPEESRQ